MKKINKIIIMSLLAFIIACTLCLTACKSQKKEEIVREKGLLAYNLKTDSTVRLEFSVLNDVLRDLHKGDIGGELELSVCVKKGSKAIATAKQAYNTAEHSESETMLALETGELPGNKNGNLIISLQLIDNKGKSKEVISMETKDFAVQLNSDSVKCVVAQMTNEEKARLVTGYGILEEHKEVTAGTLREGACGSTAAIERLGIPSIYMADGAAGLRIAANNTGYPSSAAMASTWDADMVQKVAAAMGRDAKAFGVDMLLAPGMNIQRNPLSGRNGTYFSEDPILTGYMSAAFVKGVQSEGVGATIKHLAANNQESVRGSASSNVTERALREIYLTAFEIAVSEAKPWAVMSAYNKINGDYASVKTELIKNILRDEWNFKGFVMTDWDASGDKAQIIKSMNDMSMPGHDADCAKVEKAIESGLISTEEINTCCENILNAVVKSISMKRYLGEDAPEIDGKVDTKAEAKLAQTAAAEGIVLLKNEGALPFKKGEIALFGNAQRFPVAAAVGAEDIRSKYRISIQEGLMDIKELSLNASLKEYYAHANNTVSDDVFNPKEDKEELKVSLDRAKQAAAESDCAVICIARYTREGFDHRAGVGDFCLNAVELDMVKNVSKAFRDAGKKVVVVINAGNPIEVASWRDYVDGILYVGLAGQELGNAVADVISGKVNPSGKLATTFSVDYKSIPSSKNFPGNAQEVDYYEDIYVGYRFFETFDVETAYPFGFGLSYTTFEYSDFKMTGNAADGTLSVSVTVKNTGKVSGKEVVQIYVKKPGTSQEQAAKELVAFAKTKSLKAGESQTLTMPINYFGLRTYVEKDSAWIMESGEYKLFAAASAEDVRAELTFNVSDKKVIQDVENRCGLVKKIKILTQEGGLPSYINAVNVAIGKKASATKTENGHPASDAIDGEPTTRWSGFVGGPASGVITFSVDLEKEYNIGEIAINWESIGSDYTISYAGEDKNWKKIEKVSDKNIEYSKSLEEAISARYFKIDIVNRGAFTSIYEFAVYEK